MNKHYHFEQLESTQLYCHENIEVLTNFDYVTCSQQTNGYGRTGLWDGQNDNLYYSQIIPPIKSANFLSIAISIAIYNVVSEFTNEHYLKLPNDIYIQKQKLAGYIIEPCEKGYIVGIGLNVNETQTEQRIGLNKYNINIDIQSLSEKLAKELERSLLIDEENLVNRFKAITNLINHETSFTDRKTKEVFTDMVLDLDEEYYYFKDKKIKIEQLKIII